LEMETLIFSSYATCVKIFSVHFKLFLNNLLANSQKVNISVYHLITATFGSCDHLTFGLTFEQIETAHWAHLL
jgi:hypothetical protein